MNTSPEAQNTFPKSQFFVGTIRQMKRKGKTYAEILGWIYREGLAFYDIQEHFAEAFGVEYRDCACINGWWVDGAGELTDEDINRKLHVRIAKERIPKPFSYTPNRSISRRVCETLAFLQVFAPDFPPDHQTSVDIEFDNLHGNLQEIQREATGSETQAMITEMMGKLDLSKRLFSVNEVETALGILNQVEADFKKTFMA